MAAKGDKRRIRIDACESIARQHAIRSPGSWKKIEEELRKQMGCSSGKFCEKAVRDLIKARCFDKATCEFLFAYLEGSSEATGPSSETERLIDAYRADPHRFHREEEIEASPHDCE